MMKPDHNFTIAVDEFDYSIFFLLGTLKLP